ncbi:MAG: Slp family lipoprotein [Pseudomonadota bacterium]
MIKCIPIMALLLLSACASQQPTTRITQAPDNDISLAEVRDQSEAFLGSGVRWGGRILSVTEVGEGESQNLHLEVLEYPLDQKGKPVETAGSGGRFIAVLSQPYKKAVYYRSRLLTVSGILQAPEIRGLANGNSQTIPVIAAEQQYAWRREYDDDRYYHHPYFWPRFYFRLGVGGYGYYHKGARVIYFKNPRYY